MEKSKMLIITLINFLNLSSTNILFILYLWQIIINAHQKKEPSKSQNESEWSSEVSVLQNWGISLSQGIQYSQRLKILNFTS